MSIPNEELVIEAAAKDHYVAGADILALRDDRDRLQKRCDELAALLKRYGDHEGMCRTKGGRDCNCGWEKAQH